MSLIISGLGLLLLVATLVVTEHRSGRRARRHLRRTDGAQIERLEKDVRARYRAAFGREPTLPGDDQPLR